jgi:predicted amidohydrolase YtcJ
VVLDRDFMIAPATEIKRLKPTLTMVGARVLFSATGQKYVISGKLRLLA